MDYRLGNSKDINFIGETELLTCPKCEKKVLMSVFSNGETRLTATLPFFKTGNVYFLVCPACSGVFGVEESSGKVFKKGEKLAIGNFDLKELEGFHV